ncbi:glucosylceramidase [Paenibacillus phyllosphaerae]|uniref:Glucosylceramidase n=1 Tax=Paenibacillus phyllosphaerae TaxID=274593 RepID=A0A7W5AWJ2_9BACL|nr:glycoside hydrolase family 30 beta sandwich domain-containing protein [Paenibacillus phyllosphaerae]MBB3110048.1 glucosylceramidase [Paenibacillus phyllosphaerae]
MIVNMRRRMAMLGVSLSLVVGASSTPYLPKASAAGEAVEVWMSTSDPGQTDSGLSTSSRLSRKADVAFGADSGTANYSIRVDEDVTRQQMDGFGVSMTDASAWLMNYKLDASKRAEVMEKLFGPSGIGMSIMRQPIGASDFNWEAYTYDDTWNDTSLNSFSISRDSAYIIPMVKQAIAKNPSMKVFATTWSAPAWMKDAPSGSTSQTLNGGKLKAEHYQTFANYLKKYIQAYTAQGIPIYAITPQNEPKYETSSYPSMGMNEQDQIGFIGDYLGPTLQSAGLATKIIAFDHNYLDWNYPNTVITSLKNAGKGNYVAGGAFHHYDSGDGSQMTSLHNAHPDKDVWFTEGGFGTWNDPQNGTHSGFDNMMNEFITITRNWSKSIVLWNAALDQKSGPTLLAAGNSNRGMITIQNSDNSHTPENGVTYHKQYYLLGHFSKFVVPGAYRVESNTFSDMKSVAFKNPDGSKVAVVYNPQTASKSVKLQWGKQAITYTIPAKSVITFKWNGTPTWDKVSIKANANNLFVTAENGGKSALIANRTTIGGAWELFNRVELSNGRTAFKALANNKYVTAENGGANPLIARSSSIGTWEMFQVSSVSGGVSIRADANNNYVSADNTGASPLIANKTAVGTWETFQLAVTN